MKNYLAKSACAWAIALACLVTSSANAAIAYDISTAGGPVVGNQTVGSFGLEFTVGASDILVTRLGAFDSGQDGFTGSIIVEIVDSSKNLVGNLAVFSGTSSPLGTGSAYRFQNTSVQLAAGGTYRVAAFNFSSSDPAWDSSIGGQIITTSSSGAISYGGSYWPDALGASPTAGPNPQFGAGTFEFTPVPEPEHFAAAGLGLLGLVYVGRNLWLRRKVAA